MVLVVPKLVFIRGGRQAQRFSHFFRKKLVWGAYLRSRSKKEREENRQTTASRFLAAGGFEPIQFN